MKIAELLNRENNLAKRVEQLRIVLREGDPQVLAYRTGAEFRFGEDGRGEFRLAVWGTDTIVSASDYVVRDLQRGEALPMLLQALVMFYFNAARYAAPTGEWIAFSELPDGRFYNAAFQGYTGKALFNHFKEGYAVFVQAAERLGGQREKLGDLAFSFHALPHIPVLVVCWQGDEDFPPSYAILFDASISHYLSTDACAIVGSQLTRKLIRAASDFQAETKLQGSGYDENSD